VLKHLPSTQHVPDRAAKRSVLYVIVNTYHNCIANSQLILLLIAFVDHMKHHTAKQANISYSNGAQGAKTDHYLYRKMVQ
jgi:hypothetical protein